MAFTQVIKTLGNVMASMKSAVDTWLSTNITNPSNPPLDRSLSLANACAPADLVGDMKTSIENIDTALGYTVSRNLVDKTKVTAEAVIDRNTGELNINADYQTSDFMPCDSGDVIYFTLINSQGIFFNISSVSFFRIGFYTEDYTYISYENYANSVTAPSGSAFFRFSLLSSNISDWCVTINWYPTSADEFIYYKAPYYSLPERVTALEEANQNPILSLTTVDCWGDSMTEGGSTGATYPSLLATALGSGFTVNNYGKSSQTSGEIAFRFGTNPVYIKLNGNQIPAEANAVTVDDIICTTGDRYTRRNFGNFASGGYVHCVVEGVSGQLNCLVGVGKSFTRDSAGNAVPTNGYVRVWNDENFSNENICIFWAGKNDTAMADTYIVTGTVDNIYGMTSRMQHSQFIVLPVFKSANEGSGTAMYTKITQINERLATLYPNNFLDIQAMLIDHGLEDAGITPTAEDEVAIASDIVPPSLMAQDGIHPNEICRTVYVQYIKQFMQTKKWIA